MPPKITDILANAQALAQQIAAYAASLTPPTGTPVPQNVAAALVAVQTAFNAVQADTTATPFVLAQLATNVALLLSAANTLAAAVASPSNP